MSQIVNVDSVLRVLAILQIYPNSSTNEKMILLLISLCYAKEAPNHIIRPELQPYVYNDIFESVRVQEDIMKVLEKLPGDDDKPEVSDPSIPDWSSYKDVRCGLEADRHKVRDPRGCSYENSFEKLNCYYEKFNITETRCYDDLLHWRSELEQLDQCDKFDCRVDNAVLERLRHKKLRSLRVRFERSLALKVVRFLGSGNSRSLSD